MNKDYNATTTYIQIGSQNPIEKSFLMFIEVTNLKWIPLGGAYGTSSINDNWKLDQGFLQF